MVAHLDAVTCLAVDPNGVFLLSGSKLGSSWLLRSKHRCLPHGGWAWAPRECCGTPESGELVRELSEQGLDWEPQWQDARWSQW